MFTSNSPSIGAKIVGFLVGSILAFGLVVAVEKPSYAASSPISGTVDANLVTYYGTTRFHGVATFPMSARLDTTNESCSAGGNFGFATYAPNGNWVTGWVTWPLKIGNASYGTTKAWGYYAPTYFRMAAKNHGGWCGNPAIDSWTSFTGAVNY
ncbi:hypothetical protein JL108_07290 [Aeromicrobium sp. YIM 150415]|uniref:hypothetical protein n=1 Tax=Aeromicrobium sp. YIM 150415 TaxID=2803912 RepID=UPI001962472A|nr:hypothetical protein [Aeromicrobium sp. YIM 150415]MBM9463249.1 hypothetical protein [Aeromicrobium sp. YIM 150415]